MNNFIKNKNIIELDNLITKGAKPDSHSLDFAIKTNNIDIINKVIDIGAEPNFSSLDYAIETNNIDIINKIIAAGSKPTGISLYDAIKTNNIDIINKIIAIGAKPDAYCLTTALGTNNIDIINKIIDIGAKPNGFCLNVAFHTGNIDIINKIIDIGAKPSNDSLDYAIKTNNIDIINKIIDIGAKPSNYSLDYAIKTNDIDIVKIILKLNGGFISKKNKEYAESLGNSKIISLVGNIKKYDTHLSSLPVSSMPRPKLFTVTKKILQGIKVENSKLLGYHVECPEYLIPIDNKCPDNFPEIVNNCCTKNIYNAKALYKPNLTFVSKTIDYSDEQRKAIMAYTSHGDRVLSNFTTNNFIIDDITINYIDKHPDNFTYFLNKAPSHLKDNEKYLYAVEYLYNTLRSCFTQECEENLILYRAIDKYVSPTYVEGLFIQFNTFISTSIDEDIARHFIGDKGTLFNIYIPKGNKLCHVLDASNFPNEREILLNCGSIFYITKRSTDDNYIIIDMVLVDVKDMNIIV